MREKTDSHEGGADNLDHRDQRLGDQAPRLRSVEEKGLWSNGRYSTVDSGRWTVGEKERSEGRMRFGSGKVEGGRWKMKVDMEIWQSAGTVRVRYMLGRC